MDPWTAFLVSCGIIQLIQVGVSTAKTARDILRSDSGQTLEHERLDHDAEALEKAANSLASHFHDQETGKTPTEDQKELQEISRNCGKLARDLIDRLRSLSSGAKLRKRNVPYQLIKLNREKKHIGDIEAQMMKQYKILDTRILVKVWYVDRYLCNVCCYMALAQNNHPL